MGVGTLSLLPHLKLYKVPIETVVQRPRVPHLPQAESTNTGPCKAIPAAACQKPGSGA